jgi:uncharacterized protein with FMN-binding domain
MTAITLSFNTAMEEKQSPSYIALLALTIVLTILAMVTLLPSPAASKPNVLGYRSVCSFAPAASAVCGLAAGITCTLRNRLVSRKRARTRYAPPFAPIGVSLVLVVFAVVFGVRFGRIQSRYIAVIEKTTPASGSFGALVDGVHTASASEGDISATVEMDVTAGKIRDLRLVDAKNVEASLAAQLFEAVIGAQSAGVDAVSGATASSRVLLNAVAAAAVAAAAGSAP